MALLIIQITTRGDHEHARLVRRRRFPQDMNFSSVRTYTIIRNNLSNLEPLTCLGINHFTWKAQHMKEAATGAPPLSIAPISPILAKGHGSSRAAQGSTEPRYGGVARFFTERFLDFSTGLLVSRHHLQVKTTENNGNSKKVP